MAGAPSVEEKKHTTAVNRSWSDMNVVQWLGSMVGVIVGVSIAGNPVYMALARKQVSRENVALWRTMRIIYQTDGLATLFRGCPMACFGGAISGVIYLGTLELFREAIPVRSQAMRDMVASMLADVASVPFYIPFNMVSQRQMTAGLGVAKDVKYESSLKTVQGVVRRDGYRGLFKGMGPALVAMPTSALWWTFYGQTKVFTYAGANWLDRVSSNAISESTILPSCLSSMTDNTVLNGGSAAFASCLVGVLCNPMLVMKTRAQCMTVPEGTRLVSLWIARDIAAKEGFRGFFRGLVTNVGVSITEGTVFGMVYEGTKQMADITQ